MMHVLCRQITKDALGVLMSDELIAVNQDPLGIPGDLIWKQGSDEVSHLAWSDDLVRGGWSAQSTCRAQAQASHSLHDVRL